MENLPILKDLHIRITSSCNFNCPHCYAADWFNDKYELTIEEIKDLVKQAIELGCRKVTFTGGEPLFAKDISQAIEFCLDQNLRVEVETNGVLIENLIRNLGEKIKKVEFAVSYDGVKMREEKLANQIRDNIVKVKDLGCDVKIQTVITKINIDEFDDIFGFSKQHNIRNRAFLAHSPNGNGKDLPLFQINEWLNIVKELKTKYPHVIVELPDVLSGGMQKKCGWGVHRCEIMPNGDVTSCAPITFNYRNYVAGNIKQENLRDIWGNDYFKEIRNLTQNDFEEPCSKCIYWKTCLGACRSISYSTGGKLLSPHPFCKALYDYMKDDKTDKSIVPNVELAEKWIEAMVNKDFKTEDELYESIVRKQHKLI